MSHRCRSQHPESSWDRLHLIQAVPSLCPLMSQVVATEGNHVVHKVNLGLAGNSY